MKTLLIAGRGAVDSDVAGLWNTCVVVATEVNPVARAILKVAIPDDHEAAVGPHGDGRHVLPIGLVDIDAELVPRVGAVRIISSGVDVVATAAIGALPGDDELPRVVDIHVRNNLISGGGAVDAKL